MIGKIIAGSSFGATVGYVMKEESQVLATEGIEPPDVSDMVRDFKDQTLLNPRIKNAVGHISLSFSTKDADKLTDSVMTQIAREYMERMGIRDTQFLIVRHTDQAHPHCHIVYNRVGNNGQTISDKNIKIRNGKVCKELTAKYGLYYPKGKEQVRRERLREPDKTKYAIYDAIRECLSGCKSWDDLEKRLQEQGITTAFKFCGNTDQKQGVLFSKNGHTFSGSKIDRAFSFSKLDRHFSQAQRIVPPVAQPRYSAQAVGNLSAAVSHYRSAFTGLVGSRDNSDKSVGLGGFGVAGGITLPPGGCCGAIAPEQMLRQTGESHEEHIARVTALIRQATEAMLVEQAERSRKLRTIKTNKPKFRIH
ncbi:MAG: relaxase/mobilization nuclease domain-containing protein [Alistipes sp.]|uniref:relaxase/mobilization nuclease domain-containing protein n=1 Tax=Alistipes sp. TaxID=1872444 RepID=UPI0025BED988|nr:relaxase/mobilization nuclease domain-containing protein [Alistipes sp.]MCD8275972.1 relaxase/mobilization nuclease domain-containing protein [Alistipes sp.]